MATKTYLQLVNSVLTRLREDTVAAVSETNYSALVGEWVNDAKRLVEDGWDWSCLQASVSVAVLASTLDYTLTGLNERARLLRDNRTDLPMAFDVTSGDPFQLLDVDLNWARTQRNLLATPNSQAKPINFSVNRGAGTRLLYLWETPTASRTWNIWFVNPQDELSAGSDVLSVPYYPVIQIALDYALNERGEEIGEPGTTVDQKARMHIADAVAIDGQDQPYKATLQRG